MHTPMQVFELYRSTATAHYYVKLFYVSTSMDQLRYPLKLHTYYIYVYMVPPTTLTVPTKGTHLPP